MTSQQADWSNAWVPPKTRARGIWDQSCQRHFNPLFRAAPSLALNTRGLGLLDGYQFRDPPDGVYPMEVIDHARAHHTRIVAFPGISGVFLMDGYSYCGFIQLHGVRRKGDWDIQSRARLQQDAISPLEEETEDRGFWLRVKTHVEQSALKEVQIQTGVRFAIYSLTITVLLVYKFSYATTSCKNT